jgi:hypothetical protein
MKEGIYMSVKLMAKNLAETENKENGAGAGTGTEGTGAGTTPTKAKRSGNPYFDEFKAKGASIRAMKTDAEKEAEGSKSGDIQFVIALGNPARVNKRTEKGAKHNSMECVGYRLKALADIKVPSVTMLADAKSNATSFDPESIKWEEVKAGTEFDVLLPELGLLISQPEYAGTFSGGGDIVQLHVTVSASRGYVPLSVLKRPGAVLKDNMLAVGEKKNIDGKDRWVAKEGFADKFGYLFKVVSGQRHTGGGKGKAVGEAPKDLAAAFLAYYTNKKIVAI